MITPGRKKVKMHQRISWTLVLADISLVNRYPDKLCFGNYCRWAHNSWNSRVCSCTSRAKRAFEAFACEDILIFFPKFHCKIEICGHSKMTQTVLCLPWGKKGKINNNQNKINVQKKNPKTSVSAIGLIAYLRNRYQPRISKQACHIGGFLNLQRLSHVSI